MENIFDKISKIKDLFRNCSICMEQSDLMVCLQRASAWHYGRKMNKKLKMTEIDVKVYEVLVTAGYNPSTVYKWFLLMRTPTQIRDELMRGEINQKEAFAQKGKLNKMFSDDEKSILKEVMTCVNRYIMR